MSRRGGRPPLQTGGGIETNTKAPYASVAEEEQAREEAAAAQLRIWRAHLPEIFEKMSRIADPRRPGSIRHQVAVLLFYGLLLFVFQYASRREANRGATTPALTAALQQVFPDLDLASVPHFDTVERFLRTLPPDALEQILRDRITQLLRRHAVRQYLVDHAWVVAIDGTQQFTRHQPFAPEALRQRVSDTETRYRVYIVEAVLVTSAGATLPLLSEFAENAVDAPPETKQGSETKAFRRLARRLKDWFPRRRLLVVMDGLYPNGPIFQICRDYHWDYLIVLPQKVLPSV